MIAGYLRTIATQYSISLSLMGKLFIERERGIVANKYVSVCTYSVGVLLERLATTPSEATGTKRHLTTLVFGILNETRH